MTEKELDREIATNLVRLLDQKNRTQQELAEYVGVTQAAVSHWCSGLKTPRMNKIDKIAEFLEVPRSAILGTGTIKPPASSTVRIPVFSRVAAGIPIDAIEEVVDWEEIPEDMSKTGEFFGLKIKGDSMQPRIVEGDTVIVRQQPDAESGDVVIVRINGDYATCKRLSKYAGGISLISFNPQYPPMNFTNEEIVSKPVEILGKVIENRQKY
ncbi:MAG: helix-turn-helix domain-containing protein [Lachnospiraceae bacterium]|nr:helix-turn-helix domain-containing protein [Lachnospiraceae bacterium]